MSTRRAFLQSALLLPSLLSASAFAQDNKTVSFADFENGSWGDWTVEGEAFGASPATDALFPGKIRGFGGNGFVCTLHSKKGNAAVGKAVSREFTIEKPFITFKIGGGSFPGAACLNLVVDGQVTHTATGNGSATLSDASWDVSALVGKKARLEIIDATASAERGYVMVDDIQFTTQHPEERFDRRYPYTNFQRANTLHFHDLPVSVQPRYDAAVQRIYFEMDTAAMRFHYGEKFEDITSRLQTLSTKSAEFAGATDNLTQQLLTAEVVGA